jgi:hypothetical protein
VHVQFARPSSRIVLLIGLLFVTACIADTRPPADVCAQPSVTMDATLTDAGLDPQNLDVCRDQVVTLNVTSEVDGFVHIHGYDEQSAEVTPGATLSLQFVADRSGQFVVELHTQDATAGAEVGVFTVHEP